MTGAVFFLARIAIFVAMLYLIHFFYNLLWKPAGKKLIKKTAAAACPSPKVFIDYTEGRIKGGKKKNIDEHIANCKSCQEALKDVFDIPRV